VSKPIQVVPEPIVSRLDGGVLFSWRETALDKEPHGPVVGADLPFDVPHPFTDGVAVALPLVQPADQKAQSSRDSGYGQQHPGDPAPDLHLTAHGTEGVAAS